MASQPSTTHPPSLVRSGQATPAIDPRRHRPPTWTPTSRATSTANALPAPEPSSTHASKRGYKNNASTIDLHSPRARSSPDARKENLEIVLVYDPRGPQSHAVYRIRAGAGRPSPELDGSDIAPDDGPDPSGLPDTSPEHAGATTPTPRPNIVASSTSAG